MRVRSRRTSSPSALQICYEICKDRRYIVILLLMTKIGRSAAKLSGFAYLISFRGRAATKIPFILCLFWNEQFLRIVGTTTLPWRLFQQLQLTLSLFFLSRTFDTSAHHSTYNGCTIPKSYYRSSVNPTGSSPFGR